MFQIYPLTCNTFVNSDSCVVVVVLFVSCFGDDFFCFLCLLYAYS